MTRLARLPFAAAALASASTALAAEPTASIEMTATGWIVTAGSVVAIAVAIWAFRKVT